MSLEKMKTEAPIQEIVTGDDVRFESREGDEILGSVVATKKGNYYEIGGLFVNPKYRGQHKASELIKSVNDFLQRNKVEGRLINTIQGESSIVYKNNGWVRGEYKSKGAYGGWEYIFMPE